MIYNLPKYKLAKQRVMDCNAALAEVNTCLERLQTYKFMECIKKSIEMLDESKRILTIIKNENLGS